jgi:integrase/recombinase XerD
LPALFTPTEMAARRLREFFTVNIRNRNTRRAYFDAVNRFAGWCEDKGLHSLAAVQPVHVAGYIEELGETHAKPTVKQHLAAIRMLFDWLVTGQVIPTNPAHAVRGPKHSVKKGKTSVLSAEEMRQLLDGIDTTELIGLRDRALIGLMGYTFARVGAAVGMKVEDYYVQKRRGWVRLHEKGGKVTELPCHHNLEQFLEEWLAGSGLGSELDAPLFPTLRYGRLAAERQALPPANVWKMIQRVRSPPASAPRSARIVSGQPALQPIYRTAAGSKWRRPWLGTSRPERPDSMIAAAMRSHSMRSRGLLTSCKDLDCYLFRFWGAPRSLQMHVLWNH